MAKKAKTSKLPVADYPSTAAAPYKPTKEDNERERRYRAEDGLRTCEQYQKIQGDKQLMSDIKKLATEKMGELKKVTKAYKDKDD